MVTRSEHPAVAELLERITVLESINRALMGRVERSVDSAGSAFTLFESNILLQNVVNERTQQLEQANARLLIEIEERRSAEARIRQSLADKEVLLKEIHHRVKNNLQIINSLLNLQAGQISDPRMEAMFRDSQCRIKSMALIHEKLYRSESLSEINFPDYVDSLAKYLMSTISGNLGRIAIVNRVEEIRLGIDIAIPCGLIINELVVNSLKYAFPEPRTGEIRIACRRLENDRIELTISDNGVGLPPDFNIESTQSLGMQLVRSLTDQLDGRLRYQTNDGVIFTFEFNRDRRRTRKQEPTHA